MEIIAIVGASAVLLIVVGLFVYLLLLAMGEDPWSHW